MKVVINTCYGGFGLSPEALLWLYEKGYRGNLCAIEKYYGKNKQGKETSLKDIKNWEKYLKNPESEIEWRVVCFTPDKKYTLDDDDIERHEPLLVQCVEELGEKSFGMHSKLKIVEIPNNVKYTIEEYDGMEHIAEVHRTWS